MKKILNIRKMGQCDSTEAVGPISPPEIARLTTADKFRELLENKLKPYEIHLNDNDYGMYEIGELQRFLQSEPIRLLQLTKGSFDVGNFAFILIGEERKWLARDRPHLTSSFGYAVGEIYHPEEEEEFSDFNISHAVNCYVDPRGEIWLIDPRDFKLFRPGPSSIIKFVAF